MHLKTIALSRGIAIALGGAVALDAAAALFTRGSIGVLNPLPPGAAAHALSAIAMSAGFALAAISAFPAPAPALRRAAVVAACILALLAAVDAAAAFMRSGTLYRSPIAPMSLMLFAAAAIALLGTAFRPAPDPRQRALRHSAIATATAPIFLVAGCLLLMLTEGRTDARRAADAVVVLGARAYADGRPSDALADRLRTACELYHGGHASMLIMSGGPGDDAVHETEAMRRFAVAQRVPDAAIMLDPLGVNTDGTVAGTIALLPRLHNGSNDPVILVVSHAYHLPRVRLAFRRAGIHVHPVPARESYILTRMPYFMLRESAALVITYVRGLRKGEG